MDTSIVRAYVSPLLGDNSPQMDLSKVVAMAGNVSLLVSYSGSSIKRGPAEPMDTDEVDTDSMPKKQKVEQGQQLVQVKRSGMRGKMKKKNVKDKQEQEEPKIAKI